MQVPLDHRQAVCERHHTGGSAWATVAKCQGLTAPSVLQTVRGTATSRGLPPTHFALYLARGVTAL